MALFLGMLSISARASGPNLVQNGSFEQYGGSGYDSNYGYALTDWTISGPYYGDGVDIINTASGVGHYWISEDGSSSVSLNWEGPSSISQSINTTQGTTYTLSFYMAAEIYGGPAERTMDVEWNGSTVGSPTFEYTGQGPTDMGWTKVTYQVVGTGSDTLTFQSTTDDDFGPAIDNVSLVASGTQGSTNPFYAVNITGSIHTEVLSGTVRSVPLSNRSILKAVIDSGTSGFTKPGQLEIVLDPSSLELDVIAKASKEVVTTIGQKSGDYTVVGTVSAVKKNGSTSTISASGYQFTLPSAAIDNANVLFHEVTANGVPTSFTLNSPAAMGALPPRF